jgi:hypothetical protein
MLSVNTTTLLFVHKGPHLITDSTMAIVSLMFI